MIDTKLQTNFTRALFNQGTFNIICGTIVTMCRIQFCRFLSEFGDNEVVTTKFHRKWGSQCQLRLDQLHCWCLDGCPNWLNVTSFEAFGQQLKYSYFNWKVIISEFSYVIHVWMLKIIISVSIVCLLGWARVVADWGGCFLGVAQNIALVNR